MRSGRPARSASSAAWPSRAREHGVAGGAEVVAAERDDLGLVVDDEDRLHRDNRIRRRARASLPAPVPSQASTGWSPVAGARRPWRPRQPCPRGPRPTSRAIAKTGSMIRPATRMAGSSARNTSPRSTRTRMLGRGHRRGASGACCLLRVASQARLGDAYEQVVDGDRRACGGSMPDHAHGSPPTPTRSSDHRCLHCRTARGSRSRSRPTSTPTARGTPGSSARLLRTCRAASSARRSAPRGCSSSSGASASGRPGARRAHPADVPLAGRGGHRRRPRDRGARCYHENIAKLSSEERRLMERQLEQHEQVVGQRPRGYRSPAWEFTGVTSSCSRSTASSGTAR